MDENETFEELEQRLWLDPNSLSDEELEQLLQLCNQKEEERPCCYYSLD